MTKQNTFILLTPIVFFFLAAIAAFVMSATLFEHAAIDNGHQKKFAEFAADVHSGKMRLTVGQWLDAAHREDVVAENYRQASITTGKILQLAGWAIVAGIIFQIACVFFVVNKSNQS
jgi:hypothetical protein